MLTEKEMTLLLGKDLGKRERTKETCAERLMTI